MDERRHNPNPCAGEAPFLFVSYSHEDKERVYKAIDAIEKSGYRVWYDNHEMQAGDNLTPTIIQNIENCHAFLCFRSRHYMASEKWCLKELDWARKKQVKIIPVCLEDAPWPREIEFHANLGDKLNVHFEQDVSEADFLRDMIKALRKAEVPPFREDGVKDGAPQTDSLRIQEAGTDTVNRAGSHAEEARPRNLCKVVFLGNYGAGKSTLIDRIAERSQVFKSVHKTGNQSESSVRTVEGTMEIDNTPVRFRLLDPGRKAVKHSMYRLFMSECTVYVAVCYAEQDTETNSLAQKWGRIIQELAPGAPVITALNRYQNQDINGADLKKTNKSCRQTVKIRDSGQTSCLRTESGDKKKNDDIAELLRVIQAAAAECIMKMTPSADRKVSPAPELWLCVAEKLGKYDRPWIERTDFERICMDCGVISPGTQKDLLNWLIKTGAVVYNDLERYVLHTHWLAEQISGMIRRTDSLTGTFSTDDLSEEDGIVVRAMRSQDISFPLPDKGKDLIPTQLNKGRPDLDRWLSRSDTLCLRWEPFEPPGQKFTEPIRLMGALHQLMKKRSGELEMNAMYISRKTVCFLHHGKNVRARAEVRMCWDDLGVLVGDMLEICVENRDGGILYLKEMKEDVDAILRGMHLSVQVKIPYRISAREVPVLYDDIQGHLDAGRTEIEISYKSTETEGKEYRNLNIMEFLRETGLETLFTFPEDYPEQNAEKVENGPQDQNLWGFLKNIFSGGMTAQNE